MKKRTKIGIQILHHDEFISISDLVSGPDVDIYRWNIHNYDVKELESCDLLILFARRHWRYLKFNKPYLLLLADYVSDSKAVNLGKSRSLGLLGYAYRANNLFAGYLCGSLELYDNVIRNGMKGVFYPKKYPFGEIYSNLQMKKSGSEPRGLVTLINNYQRTASEFKWRKPENSYKAFQYVKQHVTGLDFVHYGAPVNSISFEDSVEVQYAARYTIHLKYWGHVCNAVVKSLALGTPVIMDEATFAKGRYKAYIRHGENGVVLKDKYEIVKFLNGPEESETWKRLKSTCSHEATRWHLPYTEDERHPVQSLYGTH